MAGRKSPPRPKGKRKVHRGRRRRGFWYRLFAWFGRKVSRRVKRRWLRIKARIAKAFEAKVVKSTKDGWKNEFPDPRRPKPFVMTKVDPAESETYEALFDGLLVVAFTVPPHSNAKLTEAAQEAAETEHGPIAASWILTSIEGTNDKAREVLSAFPGGVLKP
jgi:hypothetical protein